MAPDLHTCGHVAHQYHALIVVHHQSDFGPSLGNQPMKRHHIGRRPTRVHPLECLGQIARHHRIHRTEVGSAPRSRPPADLLPRTRSIRSSETETGSPQAPNQVPPTNRLGSQGKGPLTHVGGDVVVVALEGHAPQAQAAGERV